MKLLGTFNFLVILLLLILGGIFFWSTQTTDNFCATEDVQYSICGVQPLPQEFKQGKELFKYHCASCHNKRMDVDMTGPALKGSIARFNNDTLAFAEYLRNPKAYIQNAGDERIIKLHELFNGIIMTASPALSDSDVIAVIGYIESY